MPNFIFISLFANYRYKDSYETITNDRGKLVEKLSFDPWGRRRNPDPWSYENTPTNNLFDRGFTGHEHLDLFALVNMNGRIYDPVVGYFTSPDPVIGIPGGTQAFNLYSYVYNNPLKYTDPSGYKATEISDIGAGPLWYQLFGSDFSMSGELFDVENYYSTNSAGDFEESIGKCGNDKKNKKSSSARRPKPLKQKKNRFFNFSSSSSGSKRTGLGPVYQFDAWTDMEKRMDQHDSMVDYYRDK